MLWKNSDFEEGGRIIFWNMGVCLRKKTLWYSRRMQ